MNQARRAVRTDQIGSRTRPESVRVSLLVAIALALACRDDEPTPAPAESPAVVDPCIAAARGLESRQRSVALAMCGEIAASGVGASVAVAEGGAIAFAWANGARCSGAGAVDPRTAFRIGSITKVLVAATTFVLARRGVVDLDAPIPDATWTALGLAPLPGVTLRRLLDHTAGLADVLPDESLRGRPRADVLRALVRPSGDEPGLVWRYANPGYALVGALLEHATGKPWGELVRVHLIDPLALADTRAAATGEPSERAACGHLRDGTSWRSYDLGQDWRTFAFGVDAVAPSGAAIASASDLARFALALSDRPPAGTPPELAAMLYDLRTRSVATGGTDRYALGLHVRALPDGTTLLLHAGNTGDFAADLAWVPERGFAVAVLGNTGVHLRATLAAALARAGIDPRVLATREEEAAPPGGSGQ